MAGLTSESGVIPVPAGGGTITWAVAARPLPGQAVSGDLHLVLPPPVGPLLAVIDGVGHGREAAEAAEMAAAAFCSVPCAAGVVDRIEAGDQALGGTRGAVAALASAEPPGELVWAGVGNIEAVLLRRGGGRLSSACALVPAPGILGMRPRLRRVTRCRLRGGDLLVMATDGVSPAFAGEITSHDDLPALVERVVRTCSRDSDDALVLAARYTGGSS